MTTWELIQKYGELRERLGYDRCNLGEYEGTHREGAINDRLTRFETEIKQLETQIREVLSA